MHPEAAQVLPALGKSEAGPGRAGLWWGPPCPCPMWSSCLWDRVFAPGMLSCGGAVGAVPWVAHLDVTFGWAGDTSSSLAAGTASHWDLPFLSLQKQAGKMHPMGMWCQAERCKGAAGGVPSWGFACCPSVPLCRGLGLSPRGEGVMQCDRRGRGRASATFAGAAGPVTAPLPRAGSQAAGRVIRLWGHQRCPRLSLR